MVYKNTNKSEDRTKGFLRKLLFKEITDTKQNQLKSQKRIKKIIYTTILAIASTSMLLFFNSKNTNINYPITPIQITSIQKLHKKKQVDLPLLSNNWSGYVVASNFKNPKPVVKSVAGEWKVPNIQYKKYIKSIFFKQINSNAIWVGIGGQFKKDNTLIQTGISSYYSLNLHSIVNTAWYELIPNYPVTISNFKVKTNDEIYAKIVLLNKKQNKWEIKLDNLTENESFEKIVTYKSSMLSAEWIIECSIRSIKNKKKEKTIIPELYKFNSFEFKAAVAKINLKTSSIGLLYHKQIDMITNKNILITESSKLSGHGLDFRIKDLN